MIGFATRFFAADDLLRILRGVLNPPDDQVPLCGDFKQTVTIKNQNVELDFTQPDKFPDLRLGFDFFVDVNFDGKGAGAVAIALSEVAWKTCVEQKQQTCRTYAAQPNPTPKSKLDSDRCVIF